MATISNDQLWALLVSIPRRNGRLHPQDVVDVAKNPAHPLHECFTWNNEEAGIRCRLAEATVLIRRAYVTYNPEPEIVIRAPAYIGGTKATPGYTPLADYKPYAADTTDMLYRELERIGGLVERLKSLDGVVQLGIHDALDDVVTRLADIRFTISRRKPAKRGRKAAGKAGQAGVGTAGGAR
jgi:hypothetical protein